MEKEDYVSFETAKLLKENGFDGESHKHYWGYEPGKEFLTEGSFNPEYDYPAPTLQMTMKWLREVHCIDIEVKTHYLNYLKPNDVRYYSGKILKGSEDVIHTIYGKDTYEEVCEAAIKYCLETLI